MSARRRTASPRCALVLGCSTMLGRVAGSLPWMFLVFASLGCSEVPIEQPDLLMGPPDLRSDLTITGGATGIPCVDDTECGGNSATCTRSDPSGTQFPGG